jgi:hypothetical protein
MKIPASFLLLGQEYRVRQVPQAQWEDPSVWGSFNPSTREILILKRGDSADIQTFLHELVHAMLSAMGRDRLNKDEAFIDLFAGMLQQAFTTAKYSKGK